MGAVTCRGCRQPIEGEVVESPNGPWCRPCLQAPRHRAAGEHLREVVEGITDRLGGLVMAERRAERALMIEVVEAWAAERSADVRELVFRLRTRGRA